jgi:lipopolysaccharide/colanic/teichoic acid biosynthesis glycosyltransferase
VPIFILEADWILRSFVEKTHTSMLYQLTKSLIDFTGGLIGVLIMIAFFPLISLAILLESGFPIFFSQERLGRGGQPYKILKFRTMERDAERDGQARMAEENDERVTKVGWVLRKTHLDELPQFINVLRGEMSLVGPRAERPEMVAKFQEEIPFYRARLLVKPGITGWAQINYGYAGTVKETAIKLEYDLYYIEHRNLIMDLSIILRTVGTVLGFKGQ